MLARERTATLSGGPAALMAITRLLLLLALGCASAARPPEHPSQMLRLTCANSTVARGQNIDLVFHLHNTSATALDVCVEQVAARVRSSDGSYVRLLNAQTTYDAACPERTHLTAGGEVELKVPAFIPTAAPRGPLLIDVRLGLKWPPEIEATAANARVDLFGRCPVESLVPPK
jgi:hypothetical protein